MHLAQFPAQWQLAFSRALKFLILILLDFLVQHFFFLRKKLIYRLGHVQTSLTATLAS